MGLTQILPSGWALHAYGARLFITNYTVGTLITKQYFSSNNVKWAWPNGRDKLNLHSPGLIECLCMGLTQILPSGWAIHAYGGYSLLNTQ